MRFGAIDSAVRRRRRHGGKELHKNAAGHRERRLDIRGRKYRECVCAMPAESVTFHGAEAVQEPTVVYLFPREIVLHTASFPELGDKWTIYGFRLTHDDHFHP